MGKKSSSTSTPDGLVNSSNSRLVELLSEVKVAVEEEEDVSLIGGMNDVDRKYPWDWLEMAFGLDWIDVELFWAKAWGRRLRIFKSE